MDETAQAATTAGRTDMSYADYLALPDVLHAQHTRSEAHDELLFIIQHQTMELWMKLIVHELDAAIELLQTDRLRESFKMLTRVARIFDQLTSSWDVLRTLTPQEYLAFRDDLGQSSGFGSWQYRAIEFLLGNKSAAMLRAHPKGSPARTALARRLHEPDVHDAVLGVLDRLGHNVPPELLTRQLDQPHAPNAAVRDIWAQVYHDPQAHWELYELAEKLVDLEDHFRRWRFNHVTTVERIIGSKPGTGGTSGIRYLRQRLDVVLFPDLWQVRSQL